MDTNILVKLALAATGATGLSFGGQDPSFDYQVASPHLALNHTADADSIQRAAPSVTVRFRGAKPTEVLDWLQKQGVSFVIDDSELPNKRISLNIQDQPVDAALDAIGSVLGGRWDNQKGIRVFRKVPFANFVGGETTARAYDLPRMSPRVRVLPVPPAPPLRGGMSMTPEMAEKMAKDMANSFDSKEFEKSMEKFGADMAKAFDNDKFAKEMQGKSIDSEKFAKQMEKLGADMAKSFDSEKFAKHMEKFSADMAKNFDHEKFAKDMEKFGADMARNMNGNKFKLDAEKLSQLHNGGNVRSLTLKSTNLSELVRSLTPDQRELHKKQGFLKVSDLTPLQRGMVGMADDSNVNFEIRYKQNDDTFVIKSK